MKTENVISTNAVAAADDNTAGEIAAVPQYRISFCRTILNDHGRKFRCPLATIEIRSARSVDRAIEAAKHRFTRNRSIPAWNRLAHNIEVEELRGTPGCG